MKIGNYKVLKEIGKGGFARTYLAEHRILKTKVCLKQNLELSERDAKVLLREAKLLWDIHHHSLPTLRDFIRVDDGSYILVMSYIEGKDLFKIVKEDYPKGLHPEHVCWMTQRLLRALHYLHFYGIIHADVKPQNIIIVAKDHNAVLVDYGLTMKNPTRVTKPMGYTPAFAAPEQERGKPPLPETDLFGLGVSMIYALGGNPLGKEFPSGTPRELKDFYSALVKRNPLDRPRGIQDLVDSLSNIRQKLFGRRASGRELKLSGRK